MKNIFLLLCILIFGFGGVFFVSNSLQKTKSQFDEKLTEDDLYFSARHLASFGADFRGLIADWYWINSLQYTGNKILKYDGNINVNNLKPLNLKLLYPMLDAATTLDPQFASVYSYGAAVLPAIDNQQAIALLQKGIAANPDKWRLYHNLGYIYWQLKDFSQAAEMYTQGAAKKDAPGWMKTMSSTMQAQGADRDFARQIYRQMMETAEEEQTREMAALRYAHIDALDELDLINQQLNIFKEKNQRCANNWRDISPLLRGKSLPNGGKLEFDASSAPLDPTNIPYLLKTENCRAEIDTENSKIPVQ